VDNNAMPAADVDIFVCTSCAAGDDEPKGATARALVAAINDRLAGQEIEGITVRPVDCLAVCKRPCTLALASADKWTYIIGDLTLEHSDDVVAAAIAFQRSPSGIVPWAERPLPFRKGVIARVPPLGFVQPDPETP
jgi:predicted metal-binding protein